MMKRYIILYIALLATLLMGCSEHVTLRELRRLESQLDIAPDSIFSLLNTMDMPQWGERRALHALLTVRAQEQRGVTPTSDSLIRVATDYYTSRGPTLHRLQAFYHQGQIYAHAGQRHQAIASYTRAKEFSTAVDAPYTLGMLYAQMGLLYGESYEYAQGLAYMEEALRYYDMAGTVRSQHITKRDISEFQLNMLNFAGAESSIKDILIWGQSQDDAYIVGTALNLLLRLYDATENIIAIDTLFASYPPEMLWKNASTYGIAAYHHALKHSERAARTALKQAWDLALTAEDTVMLLKKSYQVNKVLGHTHTALMHHEELLIYQDSLVRLRLEQPLAAVQRDYYHTQLERSDSNLLTLRYLIGIATSLFIIIGIAMWGLHHKRLRYKEQEIMHLQETLQQNQAELYRLRLTKADDEEQQEHPTPMPATHENATSIGNNREAILSIYRDNINTSKALFKQSVWSTRLDRKEASINKEEPFSLIERQELQEALLGSFSAVVSNLYDEAPNLNDREVLHCLLNLLEYSSHTVKNCLMSSSLDAIRMQKYRMKKKIPSDMFPLFFKD